MTTPNIFHPTTKRSPCLVCNHATGCLLAEEGQMVAVICGNVESSKPIGTLGHLHLVVDRAPIWAPTRQRVLKAAKRIGEEPEK